MHIVHSEHITSIICNSISILHPKTKTENHQKFTQNTKYSLILSKLEIVLKVMCTIQSNTDIFINFNVIAVLMTSGTC